MADSTEDFQNWDGIPHIPQDLLEELERRAESWQPRLDTPEREIWYELGRRKYVQFLRQVYNYQNNVQQ